MQSAAGTIASLQASLDDTIRGDGCEIIFSRGPASDYALYSVTLVPDSP